MRTEEMRPHYHPERLVALSELEAYEVDARDPDVRGWDVIGTDGVKVGEVDELIVDRQIKKVRYLVVVLEPEISAGAEERSVLLPVGLAALDEEDESVLMRHIDAGTLGACPIYRGGRITRDFENALLRCLEPGFRRDLAPEERFYERSSFDESRFYEGDSGREPEEPTIH